MGSPGGVRTPPGKPDWGTKQANRVAMGPNWAHMVPYGLIWAYRAIYGPSSYMCRIMGAFAHPSGS